MNKKITLSAAMAVTAALILMVTLPLQRTEAQSMGNYIPAVVHNYDTAGSMNNIMLTEQQRQMTDDRHLQPITKEQKRAMKQQKRLLKHGICKRDRNKLTTTAADLQDQTQ